MSNWKGKYVMKLLESFWFNDHVSIYCCIDFLRLLSMLKSAILPNKHALEKRQCKNRCSKDLELQVQKQHTSKSAMCLLRSKCAVGKMPLAIFQSNSF